MKNPLSTFTLMFAMATAPGQASDKPTATGESMNANAVSVRSRTRIPPMQALDIIDFWTEAGPALWFSKDPAFDARFRERYLGLYEAAARGESTNWGETPDGALALVLLLDQFPRNAFRGTVRMYATDSMARAAALAAIEAGFFGQVPRELQKFFVLPFAHSEDPADQARSVELAKRVSPEDLTRAQHHRDIVRRFGRFPHRNKILGRTSTKAEEEYLANGGYAG
jgi:uncharacterized protein (DUF924 family)